MQPTLVLLAAGMGSRFGGLKQLEPVGPTGSSLLEYSAFDALRSGFGKLVFIIRDETEARFREALESRLPSEVQWDFAHQRLDRLPAGYSAPEGRTKPWGTGHALLCAEPKIEEPFVVINADDYYGSEAFRRMEGFLADTRDATDGPPVPRYAMLGFRLRDTVSETGSVSRGLCQVDGEGWLQSIEETLGIEKTDSGIRYPDAQGDFVSSTGEEFASMNIWAFTPAIFDDLHRSFRDFFDRSTGRAEAEFYLPSVVQEAIREERARVQVLPTKERWFGMTHRQDLEKVRGHLARLTTEGVYPEDLWATR